MKLIPIVLLALFMSVPTALALNWHTANQTTVGWDAVAVSSGTVEYEVFVANEATDPTKATPVSVWRGPELKTTLTLTEEGQYFVGVKTWRIIDATTELESTIGWSDDPTIVGGDTKTFGVRYYIPPDMVSNLGPQ